VVRRVVLIVLSSLLRQSCLVFTNVISTLEVFKNVTGVRYINPRFTYLNLNFFVLLYFVYSGICLFLFFYFVYAYVRFCFKWINKLVLLYCDGDHVTSISSWLITYTSSMCSGLFGVEMIPDDVQQEMKNLYCALCELLRHFWACFPTTSKPLEDKVWLVSTNHLCSCVLHCWLIQSVTQFTGRFS